MAGELGRTPSANESSIVLFMDESAHDVMHVPGVDVTVLKAANAPHPDSMRVHPAMVDKNLCVHCLACVKLCPSISWDGAKGQVVVNEVSCKGCGICGSVCPTDAISQRQFSRGMVFDVLDRLWNEVGNGQEIENCSACPIQATGLAGLQVPAVRGTGVRIICSGRIEPIHVIESAQMGARGVLLIDCFHDVKEKDRFERARKRLEAGSRLLQTLGSPIVKTEAVSVSKNTAHELPAILSRFAPHHSRSRGGGPA